MDAKSNPFLAKPTTAKKIEKVSFWGFRIATYLVVLAAAYIFGVITWKGSQVVFQATPPFVNVPFLTEWPESLHILTLQDGSHIDMGDREYRKWVAEHGEEAIAEHKSQVYAAGGIFPAIVGTVLLVGGSMIIALSLGVVSAVYLSEYAKGGPVINFIRLGIMNLAGVPSIVFGMWGYAMFVIWFDWNVSLMAGWFTLAFMVLPIVITGAEESLRAVPQGFREGSLALGATKWQTIWQNVLPYALPGILTSSIMGVARIAGETAAIMFTAAYVITDKLPWEGLEKPTDFFFNGVMALPYHIFVVSARVPQNEYTAKVQYGSTFIFLLIIFIIALASILLRLRVRKMYKW